MYIDMKNYIYFNLHPKLRPNDHELWHYSQSIALAIMNAKEICNCKWKILLKQFFQTKWKHFWGSMMQCPEKKDVGHSKGKQQQPCSCH